MPWYWSDHFAPILLADGRIEHSEAERLTRMPIAIWSEHDTVEEAAAELADEEESPLAA